MEDNENEPLFRHEPDPEAEDMIEQDEIIEDLAADLRDPEPEFGAKA